MSVEIVVLNRPITVARGIEVIGAIVLLTGLLGLGGRWLCLLGGMIPLEAE